MERSRDALRIATFRPLVLTRRDDVPGCAGSMPDTPRGLPDTGPSAASPLSPRTGFAVPRTDPDADGTRFVDRGGSDGNVALLRAESSAQSADHRGNFFRLPHNGQAGQSDPGSSLRLDAAGSKDKACTEHAGGFDRRKTFPLGITLIKEAIPERHESVEFGLRILTDPGAAPDPVLRLRQDRRIEILCQPEFGNKSGPVTGKNVVEPITKKDPGLEQSGPVMRID
jgi:hypothetical protein